MQISLVRPKGIKKEDMLKMSQDAARVCYSEKDFDDIEEEEKNEGLMEHIMKNGHHSQFEHVNLTFYFKEIPKAFAMLLNNEKQYATSEKSARYTQMRFDDPSQKERYGVWKERLKGEIEKIYPKSGNPEKRAEKIRKLCLENARYMTSVFTPCKMLHTINLRQLNFLVHGLERYSEDFSKSPFHRKLESSIGEFISQTKDYRIDLLKNQTDRRLSLFSDRNFEEHFGDVYSTSYRISFAGLAQAQRHRTISYNVLGGYGLNAPLGFFIPPIIRSDDALRKDWLDDLKEISKTDFPQAQLIKVNERGRMEDFRSKALLRLCGHAQYEIMENTKMTADRYSAHMPEVKGWISTKCSQGFKCEDPCMLGKKGIERIV